MNIQSIRNKYKSILQSDNINKKKQNQQNCYLIQDEQSQREWIKTVNKQRQKRVLTECSNYSTYNSYASKNTSHGQKSVSFQRQNKRNAPIKKQSIRMSSQQQIISLKQKVAQSLLNIQRKDKQINQFQLLLIKKNQELKQQHNSIQELNKIINLKQNCIAESRNNCESLQKVVKQKNISIQELNIQNSLLKKQIQLYAKQIQHLNTKINDSHQQFNSLQKELSRNQFLKSKIQKFKDDVQRLQFLLSNGSVYAPLLASLQGKHFLGKPSKPSKQLQYWYPESLINGIQLFLKKQQVGHGNKSFTQNLVKFIYGLLQRKQRNCFKKCKNKFTSRIKQFQRKKNHILNIMDQQERIKPTQRHSFVDKNSRYQGNNTWMQKNSRLYASSLRKTTPLNGNSQIKSRDFSICIDRSLCLEKQTLPSCNLTKNNKKTAKKQSNLNKLNKQRKTNLCQIQDAILQIIDSFFEGLERLLKYQNKALAKQKILNLENWLKQSVKQIYKKQSLKQIGNQTGKWKTLSDLETQSIDNE